MNSLEEFEFWCGEYRDNPNMSPDETHRLLKKMCEGDNPYALKHSIEIQSPPISPLRHETDVVDSLSFELAIENRSTSANDDDLDGNDWGVRLGVIDPDLASAESLLTVHDPSKAGYPSDWSEVASVIKNQRGWRCELCGYQKLLSGLIQVHHLDGDKLDSHPANLQVLCAKCHADKHRTSFLWPYGVTEDEKAELKQHHVLRRRER